MYLNGSVRALIGAGAYATLVTLNPDGSQGDELVMAHRNEYRKTRNIRRDGRVAVTILAPKIAGQPTPYLSIPVGLDSSRAEPPN